MSNLLSQASLVMIPSGYKEDVVYSQIPTDGSGDLSFTRASNGTRINSAGLVEVAPWNFIQYSEDFSNAAYTNIRINVTTNAVANPINGTVNADKLIADTNNGLHALRQTVLFQTVFIYAKKGESDQIAIRDDGNTGKYASFNLTSGTIIDFSNSGGTQSITSVGNGWYLCQINFATQGEYLLGVYCLSNSYTSGSPTVAYTGNGTDGLFVWGYQANIGSTAKPYFPTTDRLNVPRLTYQNGGGGCPSLLLEKQSTNLFTYSEELQTGTGGTVTVTPNTTISPDGTQNADSLGTGYLTKVLSATAGTWTYSTFAKYLSANTFNFYIYDGIYYSATFNVSTGVVTGSTSGVTASIENIGNGWYRCIMTATTANNVIEVGFGSGNIYAWGCQFEAGSYPTSYIPTTSSSATRVADACYKTGISSLIGQTEGTMFAEVDVNITGDASTSAFIEINDGTSSNSMSFGYYQEGRIQAVSFVSGSLVVNINLPSFGLTTGRHKFAYGYKLNDYILYVDGVQVGSDTSASVPATSKLDLYSNYGANIGINEAILFPTRLTNSELASLTTI